jgi:hypothetical protein
MTIAYILLFVTIAIVMLFLIRYKLISSNLIFFFFCFELFLYDISLYLTARIGFNNHIIANINTLFYFPLAILILFNVWESVKGKTQTLKILKYTILGLIFIGWIVENFIVKDILVYNSILSAIVSLALVVISIYLINVLLFVKNNSLLKDSDGLVLIGMLIRSFSSGLLLLFMNYRMEYKDEFYSNILSLVNVGLILSGIFFLFAIICLPKNRKYTWPF